MRSRASTLAAVALGLLLTWGFVGQGDWRALFGADPSPTTWGATDPAWSPDGDFLAFSLFGSIWRVAASGGEAEQLSSSEGYHAHPAWSPQGDRIVFVNGAAPRGFIPNISGSLTIVDVDTGVERQLEAPYPTSGTPSWSPDGSSLVCGLMVPGSGSLLHRFNLDDDSVTRIQTRLQRSAVGPWISTAWSPADGEIFFAAQRLGEPQIWSVPSRDRRFFIQLPLTRYKPEQMAELGGLSTLPDGLGVVYSAVVINGAGNYELYRVAREGGQPEAITSTDRDEFNPAVSPDGRLVAHVSNHLGNIDLFTMPVEGGEKTQVRIAALKFREPAARVRVRVLDEFGKPTAARLYVKASDGKAYCPENRQIFYFFLRSGGDREGFFVGSGDDTFPAPAGKLELVALKGMEYRVAQRVVELGAGNLTEVTVQLERWTNWMQKGWYTGENHVHANYGGTYYQRPSQSLGWLQAEDLNAANMMVANNRGAYIYDKEFFTGAPSPLSTERYVLYWGQEFRNSDPYGHMGFLNIKEQVPPSYTSVLGSNSPYDFPLNTMAAAAARKQGGFVSYMHPMSGGAMDVFDTNLGAKESPVTAALGELDAIDVLPSGYAAYELWYRLLNAGLKILPGAGTDTFANLRGINRIPGSSRQYVDVGGPMSWDRWLSRMREGRVFVTSGPLLTFTVNGQPLGAEIPVRTEATPYRARLSAEVSSRVPLRRVEFIQNGRVIAARELEGETYRVRLEEEAEVRKSCWFAVRAEEQSGQIVLDGRSPAGLAHSGAIYVNVGGEPTLVREDVEMMIRWVDRLWAYLVERDNFGSAENRKRAKEMIDQARGHYRTKLAKAL